MSFGGLIRRKLYWLNDRIHGSKVKTHFENLQIVDRDQTKGIIIQEESLSKLLDHATNFSEFYADYKGMELKDFPVVNKNILNQNHESIEVPFRFIPGQEGSAVHVQRTSGSTGTPLAIQQDTRKRNRRIAELKYYNELVGFKSHEPLGQCRIWTKWQSKGKWQAFRENITPINVSKMDEKTIVGLLNTVERKRIIALRAYASWYDTLVEYLEKNQDQIKKLKTLRICISSSEALNEVTREKMKALAGIPIVEAYANEEAGMLGQQKIGNTNYYLNHSGYVFEHLKLDSDDPAEYGELARIVITDLYNYAFPLIRYDTGDTAIFEQGNDSSNGWFYISKLYGRRLDLVYDVNGKPVHPMNFARVLKNIPGIIQWQFVQVGETNYIIRLNIENKVEVDQTVEEIRNILGETADIQIEYLDDIPVLASGKRKPVVNEWKH